MKAPCISGQILGFVPNSLQFPTSSVSRSVIEYYALPSPSPQSNTCRQTCNNLVLTCCLLLKRCLPSRAHCSRIPPPPPLTLQRSISAILHMSDLMPRAASPTRIGAPHSISRLRRLCRSCRLPAVLPHSYCFWCWPCRCCPKPSRCSLPTIHPGAGRPAAANHLRGAPLSIYHLLLDVPLRPVTAAVLPRPSSPLPLGAGRATAAGHHGGASPP